jgi:hypothetical protein
MEQEIRTEGLAMRELKNLPLTTATAPFVPVLTIFTFTWPVTFHL